MQKAKKKNRLILKCMIALLFFTISVSMTEAAENQQTLAEQERPVEDGVYKLVSAINNDYVWDINNASIEDGANLQLYKDNDSDAQKFVFTYLKDGYYLITNINSNKAVGCSGDDSGVNMQQEAFENKDTQCWKMTSTENGYYTLTCKGNGLVADVAGGIAENNANMQVYQPNYTAAQEFKLVKDVGNESALGNHRVSSEHSKIFYYVITFLIVGIEAAVVITIGHCYDAMKNKKRKLQGEKGREGSKWF